jgi:RNA ligase (TIGR02306 family)
MKLATIEKVNAILPHENADKLEIAQVLGWQSVVKKKEYKVGDYVVFVPIDTVMPATPWNTFLHDKKNPTNPIKVKTVRLRGVFSQGIVFPLSIIPNNLSWNEGDDVGEVLGIKKYEKPIPAELAGICEGNFPTYLMGKTDEQNLLTQPDLLTELLGHSVYASLKYDGSSGTFIYENSDRYETKEKFWVCSRNLSLKESEGNAFWKIANKYNFKEKLKEYSKGESIGIQGEIYGNGIQGNPVGINGIDFRLFYARWIDRNKDFSLEELKNISSYLGMQMVDIIQKTESCEYFIFNSHIDLKELQDLANTVKYQNGAFGEGIVLRPIYPVWSNSLQKSLSCKIINQNYQD